MQIDDGKQVATSFVKVAEAEFSKGDVNELPSCCLTYMILTVLRDELSPLNKIGDIITSIQRNIKAVDHRQP